MSYSKHVLDVFNLNQKYDEKSIFFEEINRDPIAIFNRNFFNILKWT